LTSNEAWTRLAPGELKLFVGGEEVGAAPARREEWQLAVCC
jgi:glutamine amidotransferase